MCVNSKACRGGTREDTGRHIDSSRPGRSDLLHSLAFLPSSVFIQVTLGLVFSRSQATHVDVFFGVVSDGKKHVAYDGGGVSLIAVRCLRGTLQLLFTSRYCVIGDVIMIAPIGILDT